MIRIAIKPAEQLPGITNAFVGFDEYDEHLINYIRNFADRRYNKDTKEWEFGTERLEKFIAEAGNREITLSIAPQLKKTITLPKDFTYKTKPFNHQEVAVNYGLNHDVWILADEQGLGKTKALIDLAVARKMRGEVKQCLIVCGVNSIKYNWLGEIATHSNETGWVLGTRFKKNGEMFGGSVQDRIDDLNHKEFFLITNIETFRNEKFVNKLKKQKSINMCAIDEAHLIRNPNSAMSKGLLSCDKFKYRIAMTGTPIVNRPLDAYAMLKWIGVEKANFFTFKKFYCEMGGYGNHTLQGYRNIDKLRQCLSSVMLRRLKGDVLDLPEKLEQTEYVELTDNQRKIYNEVRDDILQQIDLISSSNNPLSHLLRLRQATDYTGLLSSTVQESAKLDRLDEIVDELVQNNKKAIIFSNWTSMTEIMRERYKQYNPAYITGEIQATDRQQQVQKFQTENSCKLFIGSTGAAGTGLTLTAASTVIFYDLPWHKAAYDQASDRAHRIGQTVNVHIIKLIAKNTIDEAIDNIVIKKGELADLLVDGKYKKMNRSMLMQFIGNPA